jgi:hypothetical protein
MVQANHGVTVLDTQVDQSQFEHLGGIVVHRPTAAELFFYPRHSRPYQIRWGKAGLVLEDGSLYSREEIERAAIELVASQER